MAAPENPALRAMTDAELRAGLHRAEASVELADAFFGQFEYVQDRAVGNHSAALDKGLGLLAKCEELEPDVYRRIHKGTPFYWIGMAAFAVHDYQTAVFFFDAGVSQDLARGADPILHPTPGLHFIQLEGHQPSQAARDLVRATESRVESAIVDYNRRTGKAAEATPLELAELRGSFLRRAVSPGGEHLRTLATAFISFFLEWDHRSFLLRLRSGNGTTEPFFLHLFKGCLLFESLLKANPRNAPPAGRPLGQVLQHLHRELGIPNDLAIGGVDFPTILNSLPSPNESITTAIEYAGKIRNTVGHNLGWDAPLTPATYDDLAAKVAASCLHAIACLHR